MQLDLTQAQQLNKSLLQMSKANDISLYKEAQERGMTFTQLLEEVDPSDEKARSLGQDAFDRQMILFELQGGNQPITVEQFFIKSGMILLPEFMQRHVSEGYQMVGSPESLLATSVREKGPSVTPIYLKTTEAEKIAGKRIGGSGYRKSLVLYREKDTSMVDRGHEFAFSYQVLRNQQLEEFKTFLKYIGAQIAYDEIDEIFDVIHNGDGTSSGGTDTFAGAAGTLAYTDILTLATTFTVPCQMTHMLGAAATIADILGLSQYQDPDIWTAINAIEKSGRLTGLMPMHARLVIAPNGDAENIAAIDSRFAIRETVAQPLMIEADKVIGEKLESAVISKESVYTIMNDNAILTCDYS